MEADGSIIQVKRCAEMGTAKQVPSANPKFMMQGKRKDDNGRPGSVATPTTGQSSDDYQLGFIPLRREVNIHGW
jgi:hypothetical protein